MWMKRGLFFLFTALSLWAAPYSVAQKIAPIEVEDQFGIKHSLNTIPKTFIFVFEKEGSEIVNECLGKQRRSYLAEHQALYLADISSMPAFVAEAFALPKMRQYLYTVLLIRDEEMGAKFPAEEGKVTLLRMDGNLIKAIEYVTTADELQKAIER